jgi:hypothetical protein
MRLPFYSPLSAVRELSVRQLANGLVLCFISFGQAKEMKEYSDFVSLQRQTLQNGRIQTTTAIKR